MPAVSKQPHRRTSDLSERLIAKIIATKPQSKSISSRKEISAYLRQYFADVPYEDMQFRSPETMAKAAISHLDCARMLRTDSGDQCRWEMVHG